MFRREWDRLTRDQKEIIERYQRSVPVKLSALARELGLEVVSSTLALGISGEIRPKTGGGFKISVSRHDSPQRQRFTVAHEISHFLLHKEEIGAGISDDALYRSGLSDAREAEANRLAADILLPRTALEDASSKLTDLNDEERARVLAEKFKVSEIAMKIRLGMG